MSEKTSDNFFHRFEDLIQRKRTGGDADTLHIAQRPRDYAVQLPPLPEQCAGSPQRVQRSWNCLDDPFWNQEDPERSLSSLSSADTHTPSDLRAIPFIVSPVEMTPLTPVPPPPRAACPSQLRFKDTKFIRGIRVLTAKDKFGPILTPKPPTVPIPQKRGPRPGTLLPRAKVVPIDSMSEKTSDNFFHRFEDLIQRKRTGGDADTLHIAQRPRDYAVQLPPLPEQCAGSPEIVQGSWNCLDDPFWNQEDPERSLSSLSSADTHTPSDLRAIPFIVSPVEMTPLTPVPPPPRAACPSQLPVFSAKHSGAGRFKDTKVIRGIRVLTAKDKFGPILEKLQHFQDGIVTSPGHTVPTKTFTAVKPLTPKPPTVPIPQKRGPRPGTLLRRAKVVPIDNKKADSQCSQNNPRESRVKLPPVATPVESLSHSFSLLSSDDWIKKRHALQTIQSLAKHHSDILKTKLHEVCLVLIEEVKNQRSAIAFEAIHAINELYIQLQRTMDPEVETTGRALLLKLAMTNNNFLHQEVNLALDAMVENCSHGRILSALFNTGLTHRCVAVRNSTAQHLHQLADKLGAAVTLKTGTFTERFLIAASRMAGDAAPEARYHGRTIIEKLTLHKDFMNLWVKIVPEKDRRPVEKSLKKTGVLWRRA
uniref:TOG array regulator of axonemal microtubules protein 1 n=1 Tax=Maylandia zebra TaxID=106582 RepID=UPI000D321806|nr:TOG array regulator of axonemal microtubules protein 1-like [Maylandia zebra]